MKMRGEYIAFFDLDGTILRKNSGKILVLRAHKAGMMPARKLLSGIYLSLLHKLDLMSPLRIIELMAEWVSGLPEKVLKEFAGHVFTNSIQSFIRTEIPSELRFHKTRNAELVILSSAIEEICYPVARYLGMDAVISSRLEIRDGLYTGNPKGNFCVGEEKFRRLTEYCSMKGYLPGEAFFYGDSISDLQALSGVGHPVCINPDRKLKKVAKAKEWDVRQWD